MSKINPWGNWLICSNEMRCLFSSPDRPISIIIITFRIYICAFIELLFSLHFEDISTFSDAYNTSENMSRSEKGSVICTIKYLFLVFNLLNWLSLIFGKRKASEGQLIILGVYSSVLLVLLILWILLELWNV